MCGISFLSCRHILFLLPKISLEHQNTSYACFCNQYLKLLPHSTYTISHHFILLSLFSSGILSNNWHTKSMHPRFSLLLFNLGDLYMLPYCVRTYSEREFCSNISLEHRHIYAFILCLCLSGQRILQYMLQPLDFLVQLCCLSALVKQTIWRCTSPFLKRMC